MTRYAILNLVLLGIAGVAGWSLRSRRQLRLALTVAAFSIVVGYPWDFVAIHLRAWDHRDAGPRFFEVPAHDLILIFLMTFASAALLLRYSGIVERRSGKTAPKHRDDQAGEGQ